MSRFTLVVAIFACGALPAEGASRGKVAAAPSVTHAASSVRIGGSGNRNRMAHDPRVAPPLDPTRRVNEQDCSKPVDPQAGNLRCK